MRQWPTGKNNNGVQKFETHLLPVQPSPHNGATINQRTLKNGQTCALTIYGNALCTLRLYIKYTPYKRIHRYYHSNYLSVFLLLDLMSSSDNIRLKLLLLIEIKN